MMFSEVLTNPNRHDPNDFVYITHSIFNWDRENYDFNRNDLKERIGRVKDPSQYYSASLIGYMSPEVALTKFGYDKSIEQLTTFGQAGLILNPPEESVCISWNCDLGRPLEPYKFNKWVKKHTGKVRSPKKLLTKTWFGLHNEMVIHGDYRTAIGGIFYLDDEKGPKEFVSMLKKMTDEISQSSVPLISVPYRRGLPNNQILEWLTIYAYLIATHPSRMLFRSPLKIHKIFRKD